MANPEDFRRLVGASAPTCPAPTFHDAVIAAASEFCSKTNCWRERITKTLTSGASAGYTPPIPAGGVVHFIEGAWLNGSELEPRAFNSFTTDELAEQGSPSRYITQRQAGAIRLVPQYSGDLVLNLICKPPSGARASTEIALPDFLLAQYGQAIASGALARVLVIPKQAWTDLTGAKVHAAAFQSEIDRFSSMNFRGQQRTPRRSSFLWC